MNTTTDVDALVIDGTKLRQAREMRGLTVAELAALCTLSREQVQHIEDGGDRPFYTPAHKLLAIRKYAAAMGIPYDDIVTGPGAGDTMPVPDDAPASLMVHGDGEQATDLRLAAVERNAEIRRRILIGAVAATIVLAIYAKMHSTTAPTTVAMPLAAETAATGTATDEARAAGQSETLAATQASAAVPSNSMNPASRPEVPATATATATATAKAAAAAPAPSTTTAAPTRAVASATPTSAAAVPPPTSKPADASVKAASATASTTTSTTASTPTSATTSTPTSATPSATPSATASTTTPAPAAAGKLASSDVPCARPASGDVKTWTPTYQRKADTRLFLISPKETTVCVHDASGKAALLTLKARTGQAYSGKPPYVVQSPQLSDIEIYLQGMRARVPSQAPALRLQLSPTSSPDAG